MTETDSSLRNDVLIKNRRWITSNKLVIYYSFTSTITTSGVTSDFTCDYRRSRSTPVFESTAFFISRVNILAISIFLYAMDLCGLVVSVADYKHTGPGFDSRALLRIFLRELGLERGQLSLVIG
jgi:hypothetical protein